MSERPKFNGGSGLMGAAFGVGLIGTGLTAFRAMSSAEGKQSYMVGFAYWFGIAIASLILLMIWNAAKARWVVAIRRPLEVMASTIPLFALLFVPIYVWRDYFYLWASPHVGLDEEVTHLLHHRHNWINPQTFLIRAVIYFVLWIVISQLFFAWSKKQDQTGDPKLTARAWKLGAGGLPFVGLAISFAAFDWYMSLEQRWFSSIWGVYYFAGSTLTVFSLLVVILNALETSPSYQGTMKPAHWLSVGKFMLAFTAFWAYIAFSQAMLTWVANLPDTTPFLLARMAGHWRLVTIVLCVGHFPIPFLILLSRDVKFRPKLLRVVALYLCVMNYVDIYWMLMPSMHGAVRPDWSQVTAFFGIGGLAIGFFMLRFRGNYALPVRDPFLAQSLEYAKL